MYQMDAVEGENPSLRLLAAYASSPGTGGAGRESAKA